MYSTKASVCNKLELGHQSIGPENTFYANWKPGLTVVFWIEGGGGGDVIFGDEYSEEEVLALLSMMPRSVDRVDLSHIDQDPKTIGHVVICCYEPAPDWLDAG